MNIPDVTEQPEAPTPVACSDLLGVGTRILVRFGFGAEEATIYAAGDGRYGIKLDFGSRELWTLKELQERQYIVLPPKPKKLSWLKRLLTPNTSMSDPEPICASPKDANPKGSLDATVVLGMGSKNQPPR